MNLIKLFNDISNNINDNKEYLNALDQAIGDGDHGSNLSRGFVKVVEKNNALPTNSSLPIVFKEVAMGLMQTVGGSSGPLFGVFFMQFSSNWDNNLPINNRIIKSFESGVDAIKKLGHSDLNDKTMLDVLIPVLNVMKENSNKSLSELFTIVCEASESSLLNTKDMIAKKGRASYLGERSIGHIDPGAASVNIILKTIKENL